MHGAPSRGMDVVNYYSPSMQDAELPIPPNEGLGDAGKVVRRLREARGGRQGNPRAESRMVELGRGLGVGEGGSDDVEAVKGGREEGEAKEKGGGGREGGEGDGEERRERGLEREREEGLRKQRTP